MIQTVNQNPSDPEAGLRSTPFIICALFQQPPASRQPFAGLMQGLVQLALQLGLGRQLGPVFGHRDAVLVHLQQLHLLAAGFGAEDQANGWLLAGLALMLVEPSQVELHLPLVLDLEAAELELDGHQAAQAAVKEEQVKIKVFTIDDHALLSLDKGKASAQFQNEGFQLAQ